jgi:hypothetical protein
MAVFVVQNLPSGGTSGTRRRAERACCANLPAQRDFLHTRMVQATWSPAAAGLTVTLEA